MADLDNIDLGSRVKVDIVNEPTNAAASKTLVRILSKDPAIKAENRRLSKVRASNYAPIRRGGRLYAGHLVKQHPVKGERGESGTITATYDVIQDLKSVQRFIEVTPA